MRRAIGCYGSKPWCRAEDQSIPPHGRRQPDHAEPILIVADFSITFDNAPLTAGNVGTFNDADLQALGIDVGF